jgi:heavy metal sensor kinase
VRSIRSRLTIWNTLVVLLAVVAALIGVRVGLRYYLIQELDAVLDDEARELVLIIEAAHPDYRKIMDAMRMKAEGHSPHHWHLRWLDETRTRTLWVSTEYAPEHPLTQQVSSSKGRTVWVSSTHRSVERQVKAAGIPPYYVRVGATTDFIEADVSRMTRIIASVGLAIFLLAPLGGYFLANRAIAPLQRIIATTDRLRPSRLDERLATRGVDDELDQLAQKINQFLDQIAAHLNMHREFLANAAHELRSPLAAIQSAVEVTMHKPRSPEDYQELLYSIDEECHYLGLLVNQLLTLAASDAGVVEFRRERVRLDRIVQESANMFGAVAEERGLTLSCGPGPPVLIDGDPEQLRQVVTNLIDNAIKFTPRGGHIDVRLEPDAEGRRAKLTVSDDGIGISAEDLPRIFDRFYRADKSRQRGTNIQGSGLGLSICQSIVARHGGVITVQSTPGRGSTFVVALPTAQELEQA